MTKIKIDGMHCQSCVTLIESELTDLVGVKSAKVSLVDNNVEVEFDAHKVNLDEIKSTIEAVGYKVDGKSGKTKRGWLQGLMYGLIPHIGCIAFIIASVLGVTVLMNFFKPLLMNRYIFHALVGVSIGFATLSSVIYLKKQKLLSWKGIKRKKSYLVIMYGSTIGINLVLFLLIFPMLANVGSSNLTGGAVLDDLSTLNLKVDIPCPGHAPLISNELKTITGVVAIEFSFPEYFEVKYDDAITSKEEILGLAVFEEYPAEIVSEDVIHAQPATSGGSCGGCSSGTTGGCGGNTCGGCGS